MIIDAHAHITGPPRLAEHFREVAARAPGLPSQPLAISDEELKDSLKSHLEAASSVGTDLQLVVGRPQVVPTSLRQEAKVMFMTQQVNNMFARCVTLYPDR